MATKAKKLCKWKKDEMEDDIRDSRSSVNTEFLKVKWSTAGFAMIFTKNAWHRGEAEKWS